MIGALSKRATATSASTWAIYVRFAVALVFLFLLAVGAGPWSLDAKLFGQHGESR